MKWVYDKIFGDKIIWGITIFLSLISVLLIYVATDDLAYAFKDGNTLYFVTKHAIILALGLLIVYYVHLIPPHLFSKLGVLLLIVSVPLLLLTLFIGFNVNSADRWLIIPGINLSFQPSDLAKIAIVLYLSRLLVKKQEILKDFKSVLLQIFLPVIFVCALIVKSNFSTAALTFGICLCVMYFGGVKLWHILLVLVMGASIFTLAITIKPDAFPRLETWKNRIFAYKKGAEDNEANYQSNLSKAAIIDGGIKGTLFKDGEYPSPPQAASDFIFSTIVKHFGLIGGFTTIVLYLLFLFRSVKIAVRADKVYYTLVVVGLSSAIVLQAFSNMAVAVNIFPVTGQPLPMVSMGGTSIWFTAFAIGIILSISRVSVKTKNTDTKTKEVLEEEG
jgi:cell division protein FtsW